MGLQNQTLRLADGVSDIRRYFCIVAQSFSLLTITRPTNLPSEVH